MPDAIDQFLGFKKEIVSDAVGLMLVILVAVGLRTRLCSVILIVWLGLARNYLTDMSKASKKYEIADWNSPIRGYFLGAILYLFDTR